MTGPYREDPKFLICPRCGELLDRVFDDVLACMRCEGIFITPPTAGLAFDDPAWPSDASAMWWKSSLECPVCAYGGATTIMAAQSCAGSQIDRCATHGLWLDRGELNRLLHTSGNELAELRRRLHGEGNAEQLDAKREAWRKDVEGRRKAAEEYNAFLADKRKRAIAQADQRDEAARAAADEAKYYAELLHRDRVRIGTEVPPPSPEVATWREQQEQDRKRALDRQRRDDQRVVVMRTIGELESQLAELRLVVRDIEAKLSSERTKLRALADHDEPERL